jgi:hypothetical protein
MTRIIVLGTIDIREGETIGLSVPAGLDLDAATIAAAIEEAEAQKAAETTKLREIFLSKDGHTDDE